MHHLKRICFVCLTTFVMLVGVASAHTATRYFNITVIGLESEGDPQSISGVLVLENRFEKEEFVVQAQIRAPEVRGDKAGDGFVGEKYKIAPGGDARLEFKASLYGDGKHIMPIEILVFDRHGVQVGHQHHQLYFVVEDGKYKQSTYEELYVPASGKVDAPKGMRMLPLYTEKPESRETVVPLAPENAFTFNDRRLKHLELPENKGSGVGKRGDFEISPELREKFQRIDPLQRDLPLKQIKPLPKPVPGTLPSKPTKDDDGDGITIDQASHDGTSSEGGKTSTLADIGSGVARFASKTFGISAANAQSTYNVNGRFSYRGLDNTLHPGWNWFVEVWWKKNSSDWVKLGSKYINWDGTWSMNLSSSGFSGQNIHVFYRPGGYYLMPRNRTDDPYWWKDPVWSNISSNHAIGHRTVDLSSSGMLAGLGDVYHSGLLYWWKFYSNNLNPERDSAIKLYFPNTWFDCNDLDWSDVDSSTWSCAWEDRVWLIPAHSDQYTIQHELGHQLMDEYWDGDSPDGAGGAHVLSSCYNDGLALSEGFANAAPVWVLSGENANSPTPGGFNIETPPSTTCNGDTNELWVAAIFWDLLDRRSDGQDVLWFNNAAEVFAHVLGNGKKNGIKDYRNIYRNAASSGHEDLIDDIYDHNTVPVP